MQNTSTVRAAEPLRPEFDTILQRVAALGSRFGERAPATEKAKRISEETMAELRETGLFKVMQPKRFGGYEYPPSAMARVGFELGRHCGSTAWCGTLAVCFGWMTAFFPLEAQEEVWEDTDNLLAVSYTPTPKVTPADGGYMIAGSWPWASGIDSAAWAILAGLVPNPAGEGPPMLSWFLVPVTDITIDHDSWNVAGLQGTGSKTVHITEPVFVPAHRVLPIKAVMTGAVPGRDIPDNPQAKYTYPTFGPTALVSPIVGMAQGAVEAFTEIAAGATRLARPGVFEKVAESKLIQRLVGSNAARVDAARVMMLMSLQEGEAVLDNGGTLTIEQRTRIRRNHGFAGRTAAEVTQELYNKSGAAAAGLDFKVQRQWRDANSAATHSSIDWDMLAEMYGTQMLGLQPVGIF
ncbi:acyl-CoA dehydrogenase family protein [Martelella soudanensis]|uniref:acyl-CoA dehydrogenase family protein n=1 Tax=unclassified Martelella TaxID=2629616 RepID=UPI0015DE3B9C|nr:MULTISPECIES: acyl-CoA dehydrogenase family protein [unclassified Martelella]